MSEWTLILPRPRAISRFLVVTLKKKKRMVLTKAIARSVIWLGTWTGRSVGFRLYRSILNQKRAVSGRSVARESRCLVP